MNKKLLAAFIVAVLSLPACAQDTGTFMPKHWQEAIAQKVDQSTLDYAMKTLDNPLLLTIPVTKQFFATDEFQADIHFENTAALRDLEHVHTYPSKAGCKAYVLDNHWVIAGGTCLWNGRHNITFTDRSGTFATGLVKPDVSRQNLQINGVNIPWQGNLFVQPHETKAPHIILVRVPETNKLAKRLQRWPKVNLLAFDKTIPEILKGGYFYINTARFGLNATRQRNIVEDHNKDGIVKIDDNWKDLSGVSTDPLVFVKDGILHWVAVNNGVTELRYNNLAGAWDGHPSDEYFYFTKEDAQFIKDTISKHDPAAWQRMVARHAVEVR